MRYTLTDFELTLNSIAVATNFCREAAYTCIEALRASNYVLVDIQYHNLLKHFNDLKTNLNLLKLQYNEIETLLNNNIKSGGNNETKNQ